MEPINARSMLDDVARAATIVTASVNRSPIERRRRLSQAALAVTKQKVRRAYSPVVIAGIVRLADFVLLSLMGIALYIGYVVPPQADCGWIGEAGPGPSYGDTEWNGEKLDPPLGYDNDFTNRNTTFMAWNLMHMARMLKDNGGIPAKGNVAEEWQHVTNAKSQNPEYH